MTTQNAMLDRFALNGDIGKNGRIATEWAANVAARVEMLGLTQDELAAKCSTTQPTISKVLRSQLVPGDDLRCALARALGCEVADLFPWPSYRELVDVYGLDEAIAC